ARDRRSRSSYSTSQTRPLHRAERRARLPSEASRTTFSSRANTLTSLKAAAPRTLSRYSTSQGLAQECGETCSSLWKWHKSCEHIVPQADELVLSIRHRCECSCYSSHTAIGPEDLTKRWS